MRNLEVINCVALPADSIVARARCFCLDCDRGVVWVATDNELCSIEDNKVSSVAMLTEHMTSGDQIVGIEFVSDLESVCLALSGGDILTYCTTTCLIDCMGSVEVGVVCMGWSPEQDVVVLVTREHKLLLMTREFDPLMETSLHPDEFGEAKPVTVGWGKKETQFHGSEGKAKAKQVTEKPLSSALDWDDRNTRISWRGDGEYFACSTIDPESKSRQIRVWSRECVLHSTGERVDGLGQAICWRPNGNLIASTQQKPHRHDVIFFERNGLQHGEFPLWCGTTGNREDGRDLRVRELAWSCDSSVLALWLEEEDNKGTAVENGTSEGTLKLSKTYVQLWTIGNYHWYLKQELRLPSSKNSTSPLPGLVGMIWDPISPLKLHLLTTDGQYLCYNWRWSIAESKSHSSTNSASVAVIDGATILVTPFRHVVVPPPMAAHTLKLSAPVNQLVFSPPPKCNDIVALLATGQLALFSYERSALNGVTSDATSEEGLKKKDTKGFRQITRAPELIGISNLLDEGSCYCLHSLRQLVWWKPDSLLAVSVDEDGHDMLVELSLCVDDATQSVQVKKHHSLSVPEPVLCLCANPDTHTAIVQLVSGTILLYTSPSGCPSASDMVEGSLSQPMLSPWLLSNGSELKFPEQACEQIALVIFGDQEHLVGLCEFRRSLYVGNKKIVTGCTSFGVHDEFLLLTTDSHTCRVIPLNSDVDALTPFTPQTSHSFDESIRRIERGSRIVTVVTNSTRLVLQMPRGNLETISPRALVLSSVRKDLDQLAFRSAFQMMRKHRINLNLMYDHSPKCFMENVQEFVRQLNSVADINLFLTELKEEDVTKTMYPGLRLSCDSGEAGKGGGDTREGCKVDSVCDAVRSALIGIGENKYLLSIITTHVKKIRSELETVLRIIKRLKEKPSTEGANDCVTAEEALKYTLFLVDVNQLYNIALGMYDFNLVLMVAEKSQKDPKEYLPFLNELRRLPVDYQRYRIDLFLRRFSKALGHISKCGIEKFPECLSFVKEHSLYTEALGIYGDHSSDEYKAIARAYGEYLVEKGKQRDAGILFTQCGCLVEAIQAFEKAGCWRQVFTISAQLKEPPAKRMETARRISNTLKANRHYQEAARVLIDYAEDIEEAVVTLLEGNSWEETLRLVYLFHRTDLIETHLRPSLLEAHQSHLSLFDDLQSTFLRHSARLAVVREQKRLKQTAILEGTYAADDKDADLFSDTSSITGRSAITSTTGTSLMSKTSGRSSKNRRKAERKKHSLREGSAHEDVALLEALADIVSAVDSQQDEVSSLLAMLMQYGYVSEAKLIQTTFFQLLTTVKSNISSIWLPQNEQTLLSSTIQSFTGPAATVNSIVAALASSQAKSTPAEGAPIVSPPRIRDSVNWKLDIFL